MAIDPKKTTIGQVVDNPQLKQEFEAYINNSLYGQPTKPATPRRRVTSTAPSTMSVEEAERIMASVPKGTPVSDIVKNPVYAEAFRVHMNHGFTPNGKKAQPSTTSRVNKSVADLTEEEFQQSIDDAISMVNKRREDIRTQQKASARTGATVVSSLGKTTPDGRYTPAHTTKPVSEPSQEEFDRSIAEAMAIANKRRDDLRRQQELSDRLNIPVQAGKHGTTVTPQGRPMKKGEVVMQVQSRAPKSQSSFDAIKSHAEHGRVTSDHVALASGMRSAMRRAYNESEINSSLGTTEGIYYTKPITDAEYAKYMDYLTKAMEKGDVEALKKLQKHLYLEHGIKIRRPAMHTQPVENRQVVSNQSPERPREPVTHTVKDKGREFVFRPTPKQVVQGVAVVLLVSMLATGIAQCNASDKSPNTPTGTGTSIGTTYHPEQTTPTDITRPNQTTPPEVTDEGSITPAPLPELENADIKTLVLDMQDSATMSSKGAVELSYAVVNEMAELCVLAGENVPDALNVPILTAIMFTENSFRTTTDDNRDCVGATQVSKVAVKQQMQRAERFYNTCMKKINQGTDPAIKAAKIQQLKDNYFIKALYLDGASVDDIWERCKTDTKLAAIVAGSALLDFEWRYDWTMSNKDVPVANMRVISMYNAGENNVLSCETGGLLGYKCFYPDEAPTDIENYTDTMYIKLDELPTKQDMQSSSKISYYYDKFNLSDPHNEGKKVVLQRFVAKTKEMLAYMAKVGEGAEIVEAHLKNQTIDMIYSDLNTLNNTIGPNENNKPSNFNHYKHLDNLGGSDGYMMVDSRAFERYVAGQGYTTDIDLDMAN